MKILKKTLAGAPGSLIREEKSCFTFVFSPCVMRSRDGGMQGWCSVPVLLLLLARLARGETLGKPASAQVSVTDGRTDGQFHLVWKQQNMKDRKE